MTDHRVVLGDCLDPLTGMASLPDKSVDHVICDPPYAKVVVTSAKTAPSGVIGGSVTRDLGYSGISDEQIAGVAAQIARITLRWALVFCDAESLSKWRAALESGGMKHARMGAWVAPNFTPQFSGDRPGTGWEACEIAHAGAGRWRWNGGGLPAVWIVPRPVNGTEERRATGHPTPKPLPLLETLVEQFTEPGDLVCDPFSGSGTTGVACKRLGRRFIGWEREPKYHAIAEKRIAAAREQLGLFREKAPREKQAALSLPPEAE